MLFFKIKIVEITKRTNKNKFNIMFIELEIPSLNDNPSYIKTIIKYNTAKDIEYKIAK